MNVLGTRARQIPLTRIVTYIAGTPQNKKAETDELRLSHSDKTVALIAKSSNGQKIFFVFAFTLHSL
jgi:hypothetical protein